MGCKGGCTHFFTKEVPTTKGGPKICSRSTSTLSTCDQTTAAGVLVQGLYLSELLCKPAVTTSMVVDWVVLGLELRINRMALKDVHHVPLVSMYLLSSLVLQPKTYYYKSQCEIWRVTYLTE